MGGARTVLSCHPQQTPATHSPAPLRCQLLGRGERLEDWGRIICKRTTRHQSNPAQPGRWQTAIQRLAVVPQPQVRAAGARSRLEEGWEALFGPGGPVPSQRGMEGTAQHHWKVDHTWPSRQWAPHRAGGAGVVRAASTQAA